jgi:hypothetical protein
MRSAALKITYILATVSATIAWIWMIADFARWAVGS